VATAVEPADVPAEGEKRFLIRGVGWQGYLDLLRIIGDRTVRLTYDRGDVELMSPLFRHERKKSLLAQMVEILTLELDIPRASASATTLKREDLNRGLEADESYYLYDLSRLRDKDELDLHIDPPPDLAIEIEMTRSALNRLGIYGALRVPEVWRFDGRNLRILELQADGSYREIPASRLLPWIAIEEIKRFLLEEDYHDETRWLRRFQEWVRAVVLPRFRAEQQEEQNPPDTELNADLLSSVGHVPT
jgi:Uma2 family endonuclease